MTEGSPKLLDRLLKLLFGGVERSRLIKKNALASLFFLGLTTSMNLVTTRLALDYLKPAGFGIWLTINSVIGWFAFFDIGLAGGLRNKLAGALAANDRGKAKTYISTTYGILGLIITGLYAVFCIAFHWINWAFVFNAPPELAHDVAILFFWGFTFFSFRFILGIADTVFAAMQHPALTNMFSAVASLLTISLVLFLRSQSPSSLLLLGFGFTCISMCIVPTIATVYLYGFKEAGLVPSLRSIDFSYSKELLALSVRFFVLRITYVVLFTTDNMIISHVLGPEHVTTYNIAYKYFSMILLVYTTLTAPLWSAFTDAYTRHDMDWIRNTVRKMEKVWLGVFAAILLMLLASSFVYRLWLGGIIHVPFLLSCVMAIFILVYSWNSVFNLFINGTGKVMLQVILSVLAAAVNIPLSIFFSKNLGMGNTGVMTATIVCLLPLLISTPLQYRKIMAGTATGIWNA